MRISCNFKIQHDIPNDPFLSGLNNLPGIKKIGTVARWDVSYYGEDYYAGNEIDKIEEKIREIMFPGNKHDRHLNDIDHLLGHIINKRDYFVTSDRDFLRCRQKLKEELKVEIVTPEEYVTSIKDKMAMNCSYKERPLNGKAPTPSETESIDFKGDQFPLLKTEGNDRHE